jgi:hypothetical protein
MYLAETSPCLPFHGRHRPLCTSNGSHGKCDSRASQQRDKSRRGTEQHGTSSEGLLLTSLLKHFFPGLLDSISKSNSGGNLVAPQSLQGCSGTEPCGCHQMFGFRKGPRCQ